MLVIREVILFSSQPNVGYVKTQLLSLPWPPSPEGLWLNELWRAFVASWDRCSVWCIPGSDRRTASVNGPQQEEEEERRPWGNRGGNTVVYSEMCVFMFQKHELSFSCYKTRLTTCHQKNKIDPEIHNKSIHPLCLFKFFKSVYSFTVF